MFGYPSEHSSYYWSRSNFGALSEEALLILKEISSMAEWLFCTFHPLPHLYKGYFFYF